MGIKMSVKAPLVVILGATGTGKTKLSLELARKFNGEIIGADSMQIYKENDIASAKATKEELAIVPHHMINILEPHETFTVLEYRNRALPIIENLEQRNKLPIIVGGTNYYIESILWKILVQDPEEEVFKKEDMRNKLHLRPSQELHNKLKKIDPEMARRIHPNDKRKILRSLEVFYQRGRKHSDILDEQQSGKGASKSGGGLRYDNTVILWLQCDQEVLDKRLDTRVDAMIEQGLLSELTNFHNQYNKTRLESNEEADYTRGVFQSIGFKEFHSYLILNEEQRLSDDGKLKLEEGIKNLKIATRRYARRQTKWVINRFLGRKDRQVPPLYGLDTTDLTKWDVNVSNQAHSIVESFLTNKSCEFQPLPMRDVKSFPNALERTFTCKVCKRIFVGQLVWDIHLKTRKHKSAFKAAKKLKEQSKSECSGSSVEEKKEVLGENVTEKEENPSSA